MAKTVMMRAGVILLVVLTVAQAGQAAGRMFQIGWDFPTQQNYYKAIQAKTYYVGDTLKFTYTPEMHNVVKVGSFDDYQSCTVTKPLSPEYTSGVTTFTLDQPGAHYFICSVPGHCADGMKVEVLAQIPN